MSGADNTTQAFAGMASRLDALGFRSVAFTGALLGEGASTIALGTALALTALRRGSVLLVDANWLQPSLTADADLEAAPGLADHLAHQADLDAVIRPASGPRPAFLPIGDRTAARPTLRALAAFLATDLPAFQTVLIDLPPVLTGEPYVLPWATLVDQLFVVLREAATPLPLVRQALERIGLATPPQIVLNRTMAPTPEVTATLLSARTSRT
jgi:Mrp family chromosome partitioning ATPase